MPEANPSGLCQCGCGETTRLAQATDRRKGWIKGEPVRFVAGHQTRGRRGLTARPPLGPADYTVEDRGYRTACWIWTKSIDRRGDYGKVGFRGERMSAHKAMYLQEVGPVPAGLELDHLCHVRPCVNPAHLEAVTSAVNSQRRRNTRLSPAQVAVIRVDPRSQVEIAREYGISQTHVSDIKSGRTWRE